MRAVRCLVTALACGVAAPAFAQVELPQAPPPVAPDTGAAPVTEPAPGELIVRLNGRFRFYAGWLDDSDLNRGGNKQAQDGLLEYIRLYPGADGVTAGGLKYGVNVELRQDNAAAAGGGLAGPIYQADQARGSLYVARDWGYLGTADLGVLRFGTLDNASSLFLTGVLENFNDGGWNGDVRYGLAQPAQLSWPFPDDPDVFGTTKIVYLSPSYAGFDFGVGWEPNTGGVSINDGNCAAPGVNTLQGNDFSNLPGCDRLASTLDPLQSGRRRNTYDVVLRYRHAFDNGVGVAATVGYAGGGHVAYAGPAYVGGFPLFGAPPQYTRAVTYHGLSVADFGLAATYAGVQIGANAEFGSFNQSLANGLNETWALQPVGAKPAHAWTVGAAYTLGPAVVGASWVASDSQGAFAYGNSTAQGASVPLKGLGPRSEEGLNAGGTLKVAPGLGVTLTYLWDDRKQPGYDFADQSIVAGTPDPTEGNRVHSQALTLGTSVSW